MSVFEVHVTVSHRYYMNRRKREIIQRIDDMLSRLPARIVADEFAKNQKHIPTIILDIRKNGGGVRIEDFLKIHIASAAMLAHDLTDRFERIPEPTTCQSDCDGYCTHLKCPQNLDGEPHKSGRGCPIYPWEDDR